VTEIGLAFIAAVRRVFPAYGDPVGRATFEAELAEIGRASTRDEALQRAAAYQERTRIRVGELIAAIAHSRAIAVDPASVLTASAVEAARSPTKAMIAFATSIAARQGLKLPRGLKRSSAICRAFLDQHAPKQSPGSGEPPHQSGPRPPSEAMMRYARFLAGQKGIECPSAITTDFAACRAFLDEHSEAHRPKTKNASRNKGGTNAPTRDAPTTSRRNGNDRQQRGVRQRTQVVPSTVRHDHG
jgi:DNA topoisomerase III